MLLYTILPCMLCSVVQCSAACIRSASFVCCVMLMYCMHTCFDVLVCIGVGMIIDLSV